MASSHSEDDLPPPGSSPQPLVPPTLLPSPLPNISPPPPGETQDPLHPHSPSQSYSAPPSPAHPHPNPPFQPLFTLIHSTSSTPPTIHHPTIHYLFTSDPASEILTSALLSSLPTSSGRHNTHNIIVDLTPSGDAVASVSSLSAEWQVTGAETMRAPTWDGVVGEGEAEGDGGLMLKIEGMGTEGWGTTDEESRDEDEPEREEEEELEDIVRRLEGGLVRLRKVVDLGTTKASDTVAREEGEANALDD